MTGDLDVFNVSGIKNRVWHKELGINLTGFYKSNWVEYHRNHCFMIKDSKPNTTFLLGDSCMQWIFCSDKRVEFQ